MGVIRGNTGVRSQLSVGAQGGTLMYVYVHRCICIGIYAYTLIVRCSQRVSVNKHDRTEQRVYKRNQRDCIAN